MNAVILSVLAIVAMTSATFIAQPQQLYYPGVSSSIVQTPTLKYVVPQAQQIKYIVPQTQQIKYVIPQQQYVQQAQLKYVQQPQLIYQQQNTYPNLAIGSQVLSTPVIY